MGVSQQLPSIRCSTVKGGFGTVRSWTVGSAAFSKTLTTNASRSSLSTSGTRPIAIVTSSTRVDTHRGG